MKFYPGGTVQEPKIRKLTFRQPGRIPSQMDAIMIVCRVIDGAHV